ncbi:MAG: hypothetical protein QOF36_1879 [Microbacteriaceae bacterium]|jgi:hypothetical protein|nr:hypothetical protein [Microbacteriaceae bacterium]
MPISAEELEDHIDRRGPYLHHVTSRDAVPSVKWDGLVPGSQLGHRQHGGFFQTRDDHVYLCDLLSVGVIEVPGERALLTVDLRQLDPNLVDPDEDAVQQSYWAPGGPWLGFDQHPPERRMEAGAEVPGQDGALARWADTTEGFDDPAVAAKSLAHGRVAYRGVVPASAVEEVHYPTEGCATFAAAVGAMHRDTIALPTPPPVGFYKTEIKRAYVLAAYVIDASMALVPGVDWDAATHFELPEDALDVRDRLERAAAAKRDAGDLDGGELPAAAASLADTISEFAPEVGWSHNRDLCVHAAERAAECVGLVLRDRTPDESIALAREALQRAGAV